MMTNNTFVIASVATQSSAPRWSALDCRAALPLAMTNEGVAL
ncbi:MULTISPECIES: hypothetical protein [unclassified Novosphingobium]|nr:MULTISPECIES: hypothetical protein [unclassified Novosphingobium]